MHASVIWAVLMCTGRLLAAPEMDAPSGTAAARVEPRVTVIRVQPGGPGGPALFEDLRLRLPGVEVRAQEPQSRAVASDGLTVFVALEEPADRETWALELITSDGRGFDRVLEMEAEWSASERTRFAAANIAQLIDGVESGTVAPDREALAPPVGSGTTRSRGAPEVILIPGIVERPCEERPRPLPAPTPRPARRWRLGVRVAPTAVLGLGQPDDRSRFAGAGALVGGEARAPRGVVLLAQVRTLRARSSVLDASLGRARVSLGGGFVLSAADQGGELELQGALSVEPWWVRRGGQRVSVPGRTPALGAWGKIVAGVVRQWGRTQARLGGWMEVAGSGVPDDGGLQTAGVSLEADQDGVTTQTPAFRLGGAEVSAGLELRVSFGVGP